MTECLIAEEGVGQCVGMLDRAERRLELRWLLAAVGVAPPVAAVDVFAAELGKSAIKPSTETLIE
jgi:hypothetical protein